MEKGWFWFMKHIFLIKSNLDEKIKQKIYSASKQLLLDFTIEEAESPEKMRELSQRYKNSNVILYAVGGDGTINLILNELIGGKAYLSVLPFGTGNDFFRKLNEYQKWLMDVNVMKVNDLYGLNVFSVGIDAEICANAEKMKKLFRFLPNVYSLSLLYTFFKYKTHAVGINNYFEKMTLLAICNGTYYGGGFSICPRADIKSKEVFIYLVRDMKKIVMPFFLLELLKGQHENNSYLDIFKTDEKIYIESLNPIIGQLDGEILKDSNFIIEPCASTIKVANNMELIRQLKNK